MSDGQLMKPEKDFSKDADKLIPEAEALAKVRNPLIVFRTCRARLLTPPTLRPMCKQPLISS